MRLNPKGTSRLINQKVISTIREQLPEVIKDYYAGLLNQQRTSLGAPLPEKKENTRKQYREKGWNENKWLVRTGRSTKLQVEMTEQGIRISPIGKDTLKKVKGAEEWFSLSGSIRERILELIRKGLK
jgi:hypothetical protein